MKIRELIEMLSKFDPDLEVMLADWSHEYAAPGAVSSVEVTEEEVEDPGWYEKDGSPYVMSRFVKLDG
jgi:hypothetical protein